jgi:hypothetical protein
MSSVVIGEVSRLLKHTLWLGLQDDPVTRQLVTNEDSIVLTNPAQTTQGVERQISLWLYQVMANEHLRNAPAARRVDPRDGNNDDAQFQPPLGLNLLYLLTPWLRPQSGGDNPIGDQQILGRAMQIFHDTSVLRLDSKELAKQTDELHLSLAPRTIEELAEVWEAMQQPYRLSVCYEVRAVRVDSLRRIGSGRVGERTTEFAPAAVA